jgi:predicted MPP superfamily phosphohydrolase
MNNTIIKQNSAPIVMLHLSDLHFGCDESEQAVIDRNAVFDLLVDEMENLEEDWKPKIVCITGDVTYKNNQSGYENFSVWLSKLLKKLDIEKEGVFICPGNHEVCRDKASKLIRPKDSDEADRVLSVPIPDHYTSLFSKYENFCKSLDLVPYNFNSANDFLVGKREYMGINFICNNSCWCSMDNNDKNFLWLGKNFLKTLKLPLITNYEPPITIALTHHPWEYYHEHETNGYGKRLAAFDYLANRCHILLTGHVHARQRKTDVKCDNAIVFAGGCYISDKYENSCSLIRIWPSKFSMDFRQYEWDGGKGSWSIFDKEDNYYLRVKEKENRRKHELEKVVQPVVDLERELKLLLNDIKEHVNSLDNAKAMELYNDQQELIRENKDEFPELIEQIEMLILEAKNE